jgi:hypothetical protein
MMEQRRDFINEPFKSRKHDFRSDKGKKHSYPETRQKWNPSRICQRQSKTNLDINESKAHDNIMSRKFVGARALNDTSACSH